MNIWNKIKDWSGWSEAGTIVKARLEALSGFAVAAIGGINWAPLMSFDFTNMVSNKPLLMLGGMLVLQGVIGEIVRRHGAKDL